MADICFLDTETLGLDPDAPVWEFAAVRRDERGAVVAEIEIQIHHDPTGWLDDFPDQFAREYHNRPIPPESDCPCLTSSSTPTTANPITTTTT